MKKVIISLLILSVIMIVSSITNYNFEEKKYSFLNESMEKNYFERFYSRYIKKPTLENRPYLGDENAPIIMIIYLDPTKNSSKYFLKNIYPFLYENFIKNGEVKLYGKISIIPQDYSKKDERYIYAKSAICIYSINHSLYYPFYFEMFNYDSFDLKSLAEEKGIKREEFDYCYYNLSFDSLKEDLLEGVKIRSDAFNPIIQYGLGEPKEFIVNNLDISKINKTLKMKKISIGK